MFEILQKAPADKIFALMAEYRADTRAQKIDLGIGVYKDPAGATPIMSAVQKAEQRILKDAKTKSYVAVTGSKGFCSAVTDLVFDGAIPNERIAAVQAPGGTGALWVLMKVINRARPGGTVYISDPTWPNHKPMCEQVGLEVKTYPYFNAETGEVRFEEMLACLDGLSANDTVLLHGCCHNPTGANLTPAQWDQVAASLKKTGAFALLDLAYLGFGDGLEPDGYAARKLASVLPEMMVAFSASKNFGVYRERVGCAISIGKDQAGAEVAFSQMGNVARTSYSQPPDHGAEIVRLILTDPALRKEWQDELESMRLRMLTLREKLSEAIRQRSNADNFDFIAEHRGMFSLLGLTKEQVSRVKEESAIYMIDDSRINVAGIPEEEIGRLADAILGSSKS
jgi:aspartate aminotransferase